MKEKIKILVSCALIVICLPYLITYFFQKEPTSTVASSEEYSKIAGILASQVPVTVEEEALKAQAVIVSTQLSWCKENKQEEPQALSKEEMEQLWGQEKYYEFYERMLKAVQDTDGQVMTFDGKVINPSFHKVSAGTTRDGSQIYKNTPYLLSVNSKNDVLSDDYLKVQFFTQKEFEERISPLLKEQSTEETQKKNLQEYLDTIVLEMDGAGYVTKIQVEKN
ncbi:MAG: hypothetical protein HFI37_00085, partial [Lachnospiraceae bacterium]|nr:hypothetical protein [Lachnospiraceae bacterium]